MNKVVRPHVMKVWSTPNPRLAVALAGRVCYSGLPVGVLMGTLDDQTITNMVTQLLEKHHTSTFRHASIMVAVSGVSRAFSHQLVRHTVGMAYEQRSQHYRTEKDFNIIEPDTVPDGENESYAHWFEDSQELYDRLVASGMPKEDARMVLPNGVETVLVWTMNFEAAMNFCKARCCRLNNYEIIAVASQLRRIILAEFPEMKKFLGPTCWTQGMCFEGDRYKKDCKKPWKDAVLWSPEFPTVIEFISTAFDKNLVIERQQAVSLITSEK